MAKRSSDPRGPYPEVKLQVQDRVRVVGIVAPLAPLGTGTRGKFAFSSPMENVRMSQAAVRHGRARQTSGTEPSADC